MTSFNKFITAFLFAILTATGLLGREIDPTLKNLDLSGFLRIRHWHIGSKTRVGSKFDFTEKYQTAYYQDMFFRNRIYLRVLPDLHVRTVFDVSANPGKGNFAMGSGSTNLITRDVYAVFRPSATSEISAGLRPFSLPGGYILARDASGVQYKQSIFKRRLNFYSAFINAFDDSDDSFGQNSDPADYSDDNIFFGGFIFKFTPNISTEIYYVFENDQYVTESTDDDVRKSKLHWVGMHNKIVAGNFILRLGGIYNRGFINLRDAAGNYTKTMIKAGQFEFEAGYRFGNLHLGLIAEGATGDVNDPHAETSFQDIKACHSFSNIVVNNSGGIAVRGCGESSWYGLYGGGLLAKYVILESINVEIKFLQFRTTKKLDWNGKSTNWLGDEVDFRAEYVYREALSVFLEAGIFKPRDGYNALDSVNFETKGVVVESMLGAKASY